MESTNTNEKNDELGIKKGGFPFKSLVFFGFLAILGFFLLTKHQAHLVSYLPFLFLLACPFMHLFHRHGSHCGHHHPRKGSQENKGNQKRVQS